MTGVTTHRAIVWLRPEQAGFVRDVAARAGLAIAGAGCPERGRSGEVAVGLGAPPFDDLRAALASAADIELVLIAAAGQFAREPDGQDSQALRACRARGVNVISLDPVPASVLEIAEAAPSPGAAMGQEAGQPASGLSAGTSVELARFCPLMRASRTMLDAAELLQDFGAARTIAVESYCTPAQGSLGSRLFDAMDLVFSLLGEPEQIDAACVLPQSPGSPRTLHALPAETLRDLNGTLTANLRFSDGRSAGLVLSSAGARWNRTLTLLADAGSARVGAGRASSGGRLRIFDDGYEWIAPEGTIIDSARTSPAHRKRGEPGEQLGVIAVAEQMSAILQQRAPSIIPTDYAAALAMCGAALLSARTGEGESPATILRMVRPG